jgi:hypothetical protein
MASIASNIIRLLAIAGLASCSKQSEDGTPNKLEWQRVGWHYTFGKDDIGAAVYRFSRGSSTKTFVALCDGSPSFFLKYPGLDPLASSFTVELNGKVFSQPHYFPQHSDGLYTADPQFARYFSEARGDIVFRVGKTWSVKVPSSPYLARLISECSGRNAKSRNAR